MYQLRNANENDYNFTFNLFKTVYKDYVIKFWNNRQVEFEKYFCDSLFKVEHMQIILHDDKEIGVLQLIKKEKELYIEEIQIDPNNQSKGIGTEIINDIKKAAFQSNFSVGLMVLKLNNRARKLYEKLGFKVVGETESHYVMKALKK